MFLAKKLSEDSNYGLIQWSKYKTMGVDWQGWMVGKVWIEVAYAPYMRFGWWETGLWGNRLEGRQI